MAKLTDIHSGLAYWRTLLMAVVLGAVLLYGAHLLTAQRIERNERSWFAAQLEQLVPAALHDNELLDDRLLVTAPDWLGTTEALPVYRARLHSMPTAIIITSVAPDGYGGPIRLLVGVRVDGTLLGVRVMSHHETHSMGDDFELPGSHWLDDFAGRSLRNPDSARWKVRKDGGEFEQFTSATITPRAIVNAVQRTLEYYQRHREPLLQSAAASK